MREISFHCPFAPVGKARARAGRNGWYTPPKTAAFERTVQAYAIEALQKVYWSSHKPWAGPVEIEIYAVLPLTKSWSKKRKAEMNGRPHTYKPDLDNIVKAIKDAISGLVMADDQQVYRTISEKRWGETGGFRVTVREVAANA